MWEITEKYAGTASPTSTLQPAPLTRRTWRVLCTCCRAAYVATDARVPFGALYIKQGGEEGGSVWMEEPQLLTQKRSAERATLVQ